MCPRRSPYPAGTDAPPPEIRCRPPGSSRKSASKGNIGISEPGTSRPCVCETPSRPWGRFFLHACLRGYLLFRHPTDILGRPATGHLRLSGKIRRFSCGFPKNCRKKSKLRSEACFFKNEGMFWRCTVCFFPHRHCEKMFFGALHAAFSAGETSKRRYFCRSGVRPVISF